MLDDILLLILAYIISAVVRCLIGLLSRASDFLGLQSRGSPSLCVSDCFPLGYESLILLRSEDATSQDCDDVKESLRHHRQ